MAAEALERVCELLQSYGDNFTLPRLLVLVERLRNGDRNAVISVISEATRGMGSLSDRLPWSPPALSASIPYALAIGASAAAVKFAWLERASAKDG